MSEGRTKLLARRECALIVTDNLLSDGKESSTNHVKTGFRQNSKLLLTRCIKTGRNLFGSVPIGQKYVQRRTHRN